MKRAATRRSAIAISHASASNHPRRIETIEKAESLLIELGAPERLLQHGRLVLEAADELVTALVALEVAFDAASVRIGALLHDAGKILHPNELSGGGAQHEEAGERFLLEQGVDPKIARFCLSHAQWSTMQCGLEDLLVALADTLWKGVRREELERRVIHEVANRLGVDPWSVFIDLDSCFERIADNGGERLRRSV